MWILYDFNYQVLFSKVRLFEASKIEFPNVGYTVNRSLQKIKQGLVGKPCVSVESIGL